MSQLPVFTKRGDARPEVDQLVQQLQLTPEEAGLRKYIYVTQVHQTVVMVADRQSPLAGALRERNGWAEPTEGPE